MQRHKRVQGLHEQCLPSALTVTAINMSRTPTRNLIACTESNGTSGNCANNVCTSALINLETSQTSGPDGGEKCSDSGILFAEVLAERRAHASQSRIYTLDHAILWLAGIQRARRLTHQLRGVTGTGWRGDDWEQFRGKRLAGATASLYRSTTTEILIRKY